MPACLIPTLKYGTTAAIGFGKIAGSVFKAAITSGGGDGVEEDDLTTILKSYVTVDGLQNVLNKTIGNAHFWMGSSKYSSATKETVNGQIYLVGDQLADQGAMNEDRINNRSIQSNVYSNLNRIWSS